MKFLGQGMLIVALGMALYGCGVPEEEYNAAIAESDALTAQVKELDATIIALKQAQDLELAQADQKTGGLQAKLDRANQEIVTLKSQITDLEKKLKDVEWEKTTLELKMDKPKKKKESKEKTKDEQAEKKVEPTNTSEKG